MYAKDKAVEHEVLKERGSRRQWRIRPNSKQSVLKTTSVHGRLFYSPPALKYKFIKRSPFKTGFEVSYITYPCQSTQCRGLTVT